LGGTQPFRRTPAPATDGAGTETFEGDDGLTGTTSAIVGVR
jgi:hypothetical protein